MRERKKQPFQTMDLTLDLFFSFFYIVKFPGNKSTLIASVNHFAFLFST